MSPDQEQQLRQLLEEHQIGDIPQPLKWEAMEPRLFPRRRFGWLLWLLPLLLLSAVFVLQRAMGDTVEAVASLPVITTNASGQSSAPEPVSVDAPPASSLATRGSRGLPPRVTAVTDLAYGNTSLPFVPAMLDRAVVVSAIPTLLPPSIEVGPLTLPDVKLARAKLEPAPATHRRFLAISAGPGSFRVPLQPVTSLPQDVTVESTFVNARSLRLSVDVASLGPLSLSTGMIYQGATNVSTSSRLLPAGASVSSEVSSLQLPLLVGYTYGRAPWSFRAAAGGSVEVGSWVRGQTLLLSGLPGPAQAYLADEPAYPLALLGELAVEYRLWPRVGLALGVSYRRGATRLRYPAFEVPGRQTYRGSSLGVVFYPKR